MSESRCETTGAARPPFGESCKARRPAHRLEIPVQAPDNASIGVAVLQPNGIFVAAVILVPYLVWRAPFVLARFERTERLSEGVPCLLVRFFVVCVALVLWCCLYRSSAFHNVVSFGWPSLLSFQDAIVSGVDLGLRFGSPQILLSLCVDRLLLDFAQP